MFDTTVAWKVISSGYHYYRSRLEGAYEYEAWSVGRGTPVCPSRLRFLVPFRKKGIESFRVARRKCKLESSNSLTKRRIFPFDSSQNRFSTSSTKFNATFKDMNNKVCDTYYVLCTAMSSNSTTLSSLSIICRDGGRECLIFRYHSFIRHWNFSEFRKVSMKRFEGYLAYTRTQSVTLSP